MISDEQELVMFETLSQRVVQRIPVEGNGNFEGMSNPGAMLGRLNVKEALNSFRSLSYSIKEDVNGMVLVTLPVNEQVRAKLIENSSGDCKLESSKVLFDTVNDVIAASEVVFHDQEGVITTVNHNYIYQIDNNIPIIIGEISETDRQIPIDTESDSINFPIYNNESDIPLLTDEVIKNMDETDGFMFEESMVLGDPSDPSYSTVTVKTYDEIKLNMTSDNVFKINFNN